MSIEQIQIEIQKIGNNSNLTSEEKISRIKMYQTLLETVIQETKYNEQVYKFIQDASKMENISSGSYQIQDTLDYNKQALRENILESDLVKELNEKGIEDFTLGDLRTVYSATYEQEHGVSLTETNLAMELYSQIETIEKTEQRQMEIVSRNLGDLLGKDIISKTSEKNTIQSNGKAVIELTDKTEEQLQADYQKAMAKIDELYVNEGILDLQTKNITTQMLNQLFNYYKTGNKKLPINLVEQIRESQKYEEQGKTL